MLVFYLRNDVFVHRLGENYMFVVGGPGHLLVLVPMEVSKTIKSCQKTTNGHIYLAFDRSRDAK